MKPLDASMSFGDHLEELRRRLIVALLVPVPVFIVSLFFGGPLLAFLLDPAVEALRDAGLPAALLATSPAEPFIAYLKVGLVCALVISTPWVLYQAWLFIAPGLYASERRFAHLLFPLSALLTVSGLVFLYTVLLPLTLRFFIAFGMSIAGGEAATAPLPEGVTLPSIPQLAADPPAPEPGQAWVNTETLELRLALQGAGDETRVMSLPLSAGSGGITQQYRVSEYVTLCFNLGVIFTLAFQLPVVMLLGGWAGLLHPRELAGLRRYVLLAVAVVSAVATPADPLSMILLMVPLYFLFEFGMILMRVAPGTPVTDGDQGE